LGFAVTGQGPWTAAVPPWRPDIIGEADLVEEVTRVHGFDHIPTVSLPRLSAPPQPARPPMQRPPPASACAHADAAPPAAGPPRARHARHERGCDLVVHGARQGRALRRRAEGR